MRCAIVQNGVVVNCAEADEEFATAQGWIPSETAAIGDLYDGESFEKPASPGAVVPQEITKLQGLLALDAAGKGAAYEAWATSEERTFKEKAFINSHENWRRNNQFVIGGATAMDLTSNDIDALFILGASINPDVVTP